VRSSLGRIALISAITLSVISVVSLSTGNSWARENLRRHHSTSESRSSGRRLVHNQTESAGGQPSNSANQSIETLAHLHFPEMRWTDCENNLLEHVATGEVAYCGPSQGETDGPPDDSGTNRMPFDVDAELIRWLCVDPATSKLVDPKGIQLQAARIVGQLDLSYVTLPFPLSLQNSRFVQDINLGYGQLLNFDLSGSQIRDIIANNVTVRGDFILSNVSAQGKVNLIDANLGGDLNGIGGTFKNPGEVAIGADRLTAADVYLLNSNVEGELELPEASLSGDLDATGAIFKNHHGVALYADRLKATDIYLRDSRVEGEVRLLGANVRGDLDCIGATFYNPVGDALLADGLKASGNVLFRQGFSAEGTISLPLANVRGRLQWISIAPVHRDALILDLTHATVGPLWDDEESWPQRGNLKLDGFVYSRFDANSPQDASSRLRWLARQASGTVTPQPYEQLAKVLRENGDDAGAKTVLIAMENAQYRSLSGWKRCWSWILWLTIRYGYDTWQAVWFIGGFVIFGTFLFFFGRRFGAVTQTEKEGAEHFCPFNPLVYSLETFLPLVDLQQSKHWAPKSEGSTFGRCLRWYLWLHILMGWFFTSILIAGITGLVQKG
jgi:hypothetical protein